MAQSRGVRGNAKNAPMSVPRNNEPDGDHFHDLVAWLAGKGHVTLRSKAKKGITGHAPGDDLSERARAVNPPPGAVVRVPIAATDKEPQNSRTIAHAVARGWFDIVPDLLFDGAKPHSDVWDEHNAERAKREIADMEVPKAGTVLDVLAQQVAALTAKVAQLEGANKGANKGAKK